MNAPAPEARTPLVSLAGISRRYEVGGGLVHALREVDLQIHEGEFVAIVGPSGSGKSTLMNILGCLDRPTGGTYHLAGIEVGARNSDERALVRNRLLGFIFQGFNLLPRTSALRNTELPLVYRGLSRAERETLALSALVQVGLGDRIHHTPAELSGGQQQRVAIARALVTNPPLLLADEPTGNLDSVTTAEVLLLLQELVTHHKRTVIVVTHEPEVAACAGRVVTVRDGRVVSDENNVAPTSAKRLLEQALQSRRDVT
jgi:putative ABC transport system ATP-binding protein